MKNKVKTEYKLTSSNLQRGAIYTDALCYIVCKTINKNTLAEIPSYTNTVYADNNTFIHIEFRINAISYTNYEKVILRFKQNSTTISNATLKQANDIYLISEGYSKHLHYCTKDDGIYRYVDITSLVANNPNKTVYFAITVNDGYISLFNENSQEAPVAQVVYHDQSEFYKNQPYLEGTIGSSNSYKLNIRSGQLYFSSNLITKDAPLLPFNLSLNYSELYVSSSVINNSINTNLPYGFKFNYQQYLYKSGSNYYYIDSEFKKHTFQLIINNDSISIDNITEIYNEIDGNYLILYIKNDVNIIETPVKDQLIFNKSGYLIKIQSRYNNELNQIITYDSENRLNIVYDGMGLPTKFYYYNVDSNKKYVFIFFGKDSINYTELNDLMEYSTAYIESTNNFLSKVKDMNGYITTYQYEEFSNSPLIRAIIDLKYYLLSKVVSCNNQTCFERNESKKVINITESNINNNVLYENKKYTIRYFGQTSEVDLVTYGIGESINKQVYHYNDLQEVDYTYTHAIDDYNFNYSDIKDGYNFNYKDIRNRINFSEPYIHNYSGENYSVLFDYTTGDSNEYKKYLSNSLSFLTIVQPCESDLEEYIESDNIENYQIGTIELWQADIVGDDYENLEKIYETPLYNVNFNKQINYISIPKDYFFKNKAYCLIFNTNRDIKIWFDDILTEGINYCKNYIKDNSNGNNNLHEINFNNIIISYNNNESVLVNKLSLQDIKVTKSSCFLNNENYNCWYNDGTNLIYNVNNVIVNKNNVNIFSYENSELRSKCYNGIVQSEIITSYNSSNNYIKESTITTNDIYSTTSNTEKYYNQSFQLIREVSSTNVSTYYDYDNNGINIRKYTSSDENIVEKEIVYIKNDVNDQSLFELINNTYNDKGLNQYKSKYNKEYLLKETINPYFEDTEKFSYINDLLSKIYTGSESNPNEINKINYDEYGRVREYENNKDKYTFVYGPRDEITQISLNNNILLEVDYLYESNGTTITKSFNNCVFRYSYDKYNRLITFEKKVNGEFILYLTYCYDNSSTNYFECNPKNNLYSIKMQDKEITFLYNNFNEVIEIDDYGKQSIVNRRFNLESAPGNILNISRELFINDSSSNSLFIDSYTTSGYRTDSNQNIENETFIKKQLSFGHEMNISVHKEFGRDVYSIGAMDITFFTLKDKYFRIKNKSSTRHLSNNMQMLNTVFSYYDDTRCIKNEKITISDYYSSNELNREYTYDKCNNIESIKYKENNSIDKNVNYIYDKYNRIIRENNQILNKTFTYEYDIMGNVISKKSYNYTLNTTLDSLTNTEDSFIYFDDEDILNNNKLNRCLIKSFNNKSFIYNEFNQLSQISDNSNDSISFSWYHDLLSSTIKNGNTVNYLYDNLNQRTNKVLSDQNSIEYEYYYDKLVREKRNINGQTKIILYMYNTNNQIDGFIYDNEYYLYDRNILGDVIHIIKDNQIVAKYVYDAWGNHNVYNPNGTINTNVNFIGNINPIRYRGYYYDVETQLYWVSSRYYSPELCRWISPDSIEYLDPESINGLNLYAYCGNDPVNRFDPTGHSWESFWNGVGDWFSDNWVKLAIGAGAIALGVLTMGAATLISGAGMAAALSAMGTAAVSSLIQVGISTAISAGIGFAVGGITSGSWEGAVDGMLNGIADGFMWGGIFAGAGQVLSGAMKITRTLAPNFNGAQIGRVKLWSPNAAGNPNTGGTLIKFGRFNRIDSEIGNMIHIHLKLLGRTINHFPIGMIAGGVIGGF